VTLSLKVRLRSCFDCPTSFGFCISRAKYAAIPAHAGKFRRPIFHITVLYIDKEESVKRQMRRGELAIQHNEVSPHFELPMNIVAVLSCGGSMINFLLFLFLV
jgi:hypothetical protein